MITSLQILEYILANKLHVEDGDFLLQEKVTSMGVDAVTSARVWIWGRFLHAGEQALFETMTADILGKLDETDLVSLDTIRVKLESESVSEVPKTVMIFDVWCQMAVANIWEYAKIEAQGMYSKREAQEMINAIIGLDAYPPGSGESGASGDRQMGDPFIETSNYTKEQISVECEGYDPPLGAEEEVLDAVYTRG